MKATSAAISPSDAARHGPQLAESPPKLARAQGELRLAFKRRGALTVLDTLYQQGCAKARLPRGEPGAWMQAISINTAGGLTGGDRLDVTVTWGEGTQACVAGQAAEKIYRAAGGTARVQARLTVGAGARAEWLPQETIFFDRASLSRDTVVSLMPDSEFLGVESVVLGRAAMGETVRSGALRDAWRIQRGGRPIYADVVAVEGDIAARLGRRATAGGAGAFATILFAAPQAEARLEAVRAAIAEEREGCEAAASAWDGLLVVRMVARDGDALRPMVLAALAPLRAARAMPRVWNC